MSEAQWTIAQAIQQGCRSLPGSDSARLDSEILLLKVINDSLSASYSRAWLMTWPETLLTNQQKQQFTHYLQCRSKGRPIAYITGEQDFWTLSLKVTTATLIPRPETELLVECVMEKIPHNSIQNVLDLGTGSGAIALAIASERKNAHVLASDFSSAALSIAKENALTAQLNNVSFCQSHWFDDIPEQQFNIIVSNPPYIAENDPLLEENVKKYEPLSALHSEDNGLCAIIEIIKHTPSYLQTGGWLLFEHGYNQAEAVQNLLQQSDFKQISTINDLNHQPRVTMAQH